MKRIGRFVIDARDARARRHLACVAWVPRSRREAWATRALAAAPWLASAATIPLLGAPAHALAPVGAPAHDEALSAVRALLGPDVVAPLALLPAHSSPAPRRLLWLWRAAEEVPFALAKVAPASAAALLSAEAGALASVAALALPEFAGMLPRVLACETTGAMAVLAMTALPGEPLARRHRLDAPMSWDERVSAGTGRMLGALHGATAEGRHALLHGDAWSRNVLVARGRVTGLVDWEASRRGEPAREIARFLATSAQACVAGRAPMPPPRLHAWPSAARALVAAWTERTGGGFEPFTDSLLGEEMAALARSGTAT